MKHEEIVALIREAGFDVELPSIQSGNALSYKLVKLAIADEREACAKVADEKARTCLHPDEIAAAIRARGQQ